MCNPHGNSWIRWLDICLYLSTGDWRVVHAQNIVRIVKNRLVRYFVRLNKSYAFRFISHVCLSSLHIFVCPFTVVCLPPVCPHSYVCLSVCVPAEVSSEVNCLSLPLTRTKSSFGSCLTVSVSASSLSFFLLS